MGSRGGRENDIHWRDGSSRDGRGGERCVREGGGSEKGRPRHSCTCEREGEELWGGGGGAGVAQRGRIRLGLETSSSTPTPILGGIEKIPSQKPGEKKRMANVPRSSIAEKPRVCFMAKNLHPCILLKPAFLSDPGPKHSGASKKRLDQW